MLLSTEGTHGGLGWAPRCPLAGVPPRVAHFHPHDVHGDASVMGLHPGPLGSPGTRSSPVAITATRRNFLKVFEGLLGFLSHSHSHSHPHSHFYLILIHSPIHSFILLPLLLRLFFCSRICLKPYISWAYLHDPNPRGGEGGDPASSGKKG